MVDTKKVLVLFLWIIFIAIMIPWNEQWRVEVQQDGVHFIERSLDYDSVYLTEAEILKGIDSNYIR